VMAIPAERIWLVVRKKINKPVTQESIDYR
jgi:hypothetical protein